MDLSFKLPYAPDESADALQTLRHIKIGPVTRMQGNAYLSGQGNPCVVAFSDPPGEVLAGKWVVRVSEVGGFLIMKNGEIVSGCYLGPDKQVLTWNSRWLVVGHAMPYCDIAKTTAKIAEQGRWTRPERAEGVSS